MKKIYRAAEIFTGKNWLKDQCIFVENNIITSIVPSTEIKETVEDLHGKVVPAFIDIQLYGAYGKLFSVYPDTDALDKLRDYCFKGGAHFFMPTVATNTNEVIHACIDAIRVYWQKGGEGCLGLHVEGPWLNKAKRGAHIEAFIHSPTLEEVQALLEYGKDVIKIITIAPEVCSDEIIALIQSHNIVVSAGHSNATYKQAMAAFDKGIHAATHLFNAMSPLQHREPGLVGAIFNHPKVMSSIVPDGYHVDFAAVQIAKRQMQERLFVITDAVTETTEGAYPHQLAGDKYESNGILSGSALDMAKALRNLVTYCNIELDEALRMVSLYPAQVMGLDKSLGKIAVGHTAHFVCLNDQLEIIPRP